MPEQRNRRSLRLPEYDYTSTGAYFVTICAYQRRLLFEDRHLMAILEEEWHGLAQRFPTATLDAFVIMPNHIHFILILNDVGAGLAPAPKAPATATSTANDRTQGRAGASPAPTLSAIVGAYKSLVAAKWLHWLKMNWPETDGRVWQRDYYERIVRNENELDRIREYIMNNPLQWRLDHENPAAVPDTAYERDRAWIEDHAPETEVAHATENFV